MQLFIFICLAHFYLGDTCSQVPVEKLDEGMLYRNRQLDQLKQILHSNRQSGPQPDLDIWWRHPHLQNGAHADKTRGKVTSWLFAAPRSVLSPYYFESCDFRQWEIRGVKKKCRPMNVCAFLGGKTTEHESFPGQRNARQRAKHRKKEGECHFWARWKSFFEIYSKFACW